MKLYKYTAIGVNEADAVRSVRPKGKKCSLSQRHRKGNSYPLEYKHIIDEAAPIMIANERKWYRENDSEMLARLNEEGVRMSCTDKKPFQETSQKIYKMWAERIGGMELIKQILDFDYQ